MRRFAHTKPGNSVVQEATTADARQFQMKSALGPSRPPGLLCLIMQRNMNDSVTGPAMNILLLKLAVSVMVASLFYSTRADAQVAPTTTKAESVKITQGPEIERADSYLTIIRWTTNNPGGSPEHYGVVHYATNAKDLRQT